MQPEKNECRLCGESNWDVLEEHLVAFSGEEAEDALWGPPIYMILCVNCHRVIHRCCWALIGEDSQVILAKYFVLLQSLPHSLSEKLQSELRAAIDSVTLQYQRVGIVAPVKVSAETKCVLCGCLNADFMEEHTVISKGEYNYLGADVIVNVCASCHRVILKFYNGKVLPSSPQSRLLLHKYLNQFEDHLPPSVKEDLIRLCGV